MILLRSIIPEKPQVALEAVKLMAAVCLVPPDGHDATLASISEAGDTREVDRFQPIVQGSVSLHSCLSFNQAVRFAARYGLNFSLIF